MAKTFNNTTERVVDDLKTVVKTGDKVVVASACFSIYAFQALMEQLKGLDELRFLFTSPTTTRLPRTIQNSSSASVSSNGSRTSPSIWRT